MRVGAVDIGTNTVRLLVADTAGAAMTDVIREVVVTRLGQGVDRAGRFHPDALARTARVLGRYGRLLDDHEVTARRAIATSATRDAADAAAFLDEAERLLGVRPEVIEGDEEARLSFRGATSGRKVAGRLLVIDLGGGSTEFVAGGEEIIYARSVDIGSVRLTERCLGRQPATGEQIAAARRHAGMLFAGDVDLPAVDSVVGVAGTFTTLAAMHLELPAYSRERVDGTALTGADLTALVDRLGVMTLAEIEAVPSMDPARAPVVLGGAIVAEQAVAAGGCDLVTVSESDILDGVALSLVR